MLNFCQMTFSAFIEMIIGFFIVIIYHTCLFSYVEPSLHLRGDSQLILVYDPFTELLKSVYKNFVQNFYMCLHQGYWPVVHFSCSILIWFWNQSDAGLIRCNLEYSFCFNFLEKFENFWHQIFLNLWLPVNY